MKAKVATKEPIQISRSRRQPIMANKIREIRRARGISLGNMAIDLGVSKSTLSTWETYQREISQRDMLAIAAYLQEPIIVVFFHEFEAK